MNTFRSLALGATLLAGAGAITAAPAFADRRPAQPAAGAGVNVAALSGPVRNAGAAAQAALTATPADLATAELQVRTIETAAQNDDDRYLGAQMRLQLELAKYNALPEAARNPGTLAAPMDAVINNVRTSPEQLQRLVYTRAGFYYDARQYSQALPLLLRAQQLGMNSADLSLSIARAKVETGDIAGGIAELQRAVAAEKTAGRKPPESWYRFAISRLYNAHLTDQTVAWTRLWLADYGTRANWRDAVYSFGLTGNNAAVSSRQRLDLYRLMRATHSLAGQRDYLEYADAAANVGQVAEVRAAIQEGRANGTIPAGDSTAAALLTRATAGAASLRPLAAQEAAARSATTGSEPMLVADFYLGAGDYAKAADLFRLALQRGGVDASQTNLHLGMALALAGNRAEAQAALALVPQGNTNGQIATLWTTYVTTPPAA